MEKSKLRGADIVTSVLFLILGIWMIVQALQMPLKDSYAGVNSVWYVSPALMPLIIGAALILLALAILLHAVRNGGMLQLKAIIASIRTSKFLGDANIRYASVLIPLLSLVYLNLTRIDFFLSILLFLSFTITVFHIDEVRFFRRTLYLYAMQMSLFLICTIFGLDKMMNAVFAYAYDVLALVMIIVLIVFMRRNLGLADPETAHGKFRQAMWMTFLTPVLVVPVFRFLLRVPLPKEGGIVQLMSLVYYTLR